MESAPNQVDWVPAVSELYYGLNPISLDDAWITLLERPIVNVSVIFFSDFSKCRSTTFPNRHYVTNLNLIWICLFIFLLALSYFKISMVHFELVWTEIGSICLGTIENSYKRFFNYSASVQVVSRVISSDSMVLLAIIIYLQDFQDTATPSNINTYLVVDLPLLESVTPLTSL